MSSVQACRAAFDDARHLSVGVEEELLLVDPQSLDLAPVAAAVLRRLEADPRFKHELSAAQVELVTPVCAHVPEAMAALAGARSRLRAAAGGLARLAGAGAHPFAAEWADFSPGERYAALAARYRWAARRGALCAGLHVHVGVRGADRALAVWNALRGFMPELLALAANAPYLGGRDTGLATVRPKLAESLPRQGVAPAFASFEAYADVVRRGVAGGAFADAGELWWECRLHPVLGTLEVRVPDAQSSLADAGAIAALVHALVARLCERHDAGEALPRPAALLVAENRWRALADGAGGTLLDLDGGPSQPARRRLEALIDDCAPAAARLDAAALLDGARTLLEQPPAERQRAVARREGLRGLVAWLADRTESAG
jgi:glutamate---cysteine ligase / carboxylate-amine ligase